MKILGIDPSLSCLGWGIIKQESPKIHYISSGVLKTKAGEAMHLRLSYIASEIEKIINLHQPNAISMEETFININPGSSLKLAYLRGALMSSIGKTKLPFYEYAPNKIKKTIVGSGHAQKDQVKHMVNMIISGNTDHICTDEADAIAAAYTCLVSNRSF